MVPHYAPAPNAVCAGSSLRGCPPLGFTNPTPKPTVVEDGRQIDLEEATGTFKPNGVNELRLNKHIGRRLRQKRTERGLSLPQLGQRVARSGQQIQKYETGHDAVKAAVLFQLAEALSEHPKEEALAALKSVNLLSIEDDCAGINDLEEVIRAFCAGDASSFEIALGNLFPNNRTAITFGLHVHPMKVAA